MFYECLMEGPVAEHGPAPRTRVGEVAVGASTCSAPAKWADAVCFEKRIRTRGRDHSRVRLVIRKKPAAGVCKHAVFNAIADGGDVKSNPDDGSNCRATPVAVIRQENEIDGYTTTTV